MSLMAMFYAMHKFHALSYEGVFVNACDQDVQRRKGGSGIRELNGASSGYFMNGLSNERNRNGAEGTHGGG
jgi:hypothetical protein